MTKFSGGGNEHERMYNQGHVLNIATGVCLLARRRSGQMGNGAQRAYSRKGGDPPLRKMPCV
jgi:hypothetical protein